MIKVSYAQTVYGQAEIDAVVECLRKGTQMGENASRFESKISSIFDSLMRSLWRASEICIKARKA